MKFNSVPTSVGSLPHTSVEKAMELTLKYNPELPAWPQLPKITFKENMYAQYAEAFPGIIIDEKEQKIFVNTSDAFNNLEKFYEHFLASDWDYFAISKQYSSGFNAFLSQLPVINASAVKIQVTGPLTYGLTVKDENGQAIFYNEQLKDVVIKHITSKSIWQIKKILTAKREIQAIIVSLDEPYLAAYGSAFTAISREDVINSLGEVIQNVKNIIPSLNTKAEILFATHCCANTDWSVLIDAGVNILSFDAYGYFDSLLLYRDKLNSFIKNNGILAWGIVPTSEEQLAKENADSLAKIAENHIKTLETKGFDTNIIRNQMILTPACGLGSLSEKTAEYALSTLFDLSKILK
ncbi:MAG: hypothetical protein A2252_07025 [Elusimicrobia bacterium RIFOXYA2_FULL_39_19]|nr:MAG: hypothetical protein A2252_07025 [Elusimicrobia bacterium RIFOXYA2_FULL_39_19]